MFDRHAPKRRASDAAPWAGGVTAFAHGSPLRPRDLAARRTAAGAHSPSMMAAPGQRCGSSLQAVLNLPVIREAMTTRDFTKLSHSQLLGIAACCVPELSSQSAKGGAGRLAVVGGSLEYTGAPYFAAAAMLHGGADLSHVFCERSAGTAIKSYSPELIVHPVLQATPPGSAQPSEEEIQQMVATASEEVGQWFPRVDGVIIGPGLGRDPVVIETCSRLVMKAAEHKKPLLLDADGLFILTCALSPRSGTPTVTQAAMLDALKNCHLTITPNKAEWQRLCEALDLIPSDQEALPQAKKLAHEAARRIGKRTTIVVKGPHDVISDGMRTMVCDGKGSPRRVGGQVWFGIHTRARTHPPTHVRARTHTHTAGGQVWFGP